MLRFSAMFIRSSASWSAKARSKLKLPMTVIGTRFGVRLMVERIQLSRRKGWRMPENTVKVSRPGKFGNPFPVKKATSTTMGVTSDIWIVGTWEGPALWIKHSEAEAVDVAIQAYRAWITSPERSKFLADARIELRGKSLACWCRAGTPCHADVLLELANVPA